MRLKSLNFQKDYKIEVMGREDGYKIRNKAGIHFITFAVVEWIDVFTRKAYRDIVLESIRYCQKEKGLELYCWCLMSNHIHMIVSAKENNISDVLRDFKKFTSKSSYLISKQTKRKVDESGCWNYLRRQVKPIAETSAINFGVRITNQRN